MQIACDLHIHSALSPCGDMDMTPNNIVNMAVLNGLSMIALTDHNTVGNVRSVMTCAEQANLCVVPGMEVETVEEAHFVCLFPTITKAEDFETYIRPYFLPIENRRDIFGEQAYMNEKDEIIGYESQLLTTALTCSVYDVVPQVRSLGGLIMPAHVDKDAYSIISNLGVVPEDLNFSTLEISKNSTREQVLEQWPYLEQYRLLTSSDAHYLWDIYERQNLLTLEEVSGACLIETLKIKKGIM
ncbi:MAG: PHP domain-containing protein [Ruminococcaceae bacterium]|nr:PHP domain-containing protein [Oscillospiraceae bacterium]